MVATLRKHCNNSVVRRWRLASQKLSSWTLLQGCNTVSSWAWSYSFRNPSLLLLFKVYSDKVFPSLQNCRCHQKCKALTKYHTRMLKIILAGVCKIILRESDWIFWKPLTELSVVVLTLNHFQPMFIYNWCFQEV